MPTPEELTPEERLERLEMVVDGLVVLCDLTSARAEALQALLSERGLFSEADVLAGMERAIAATEEALAVEPRFRGFREWKASQRQMEGRGPAPDDQGRRD